MKGWTPRLALRKRLKVNWKWVIREGLDEIRRLSWNTTALQLNWGSMRHSPYNSKLSRDKKKRTQALSRLYSIRCLSSKENVEPVYFFTFQITRPIPVCEVYNATKENWNILRFSWRSNLQNQRIPPALAGEIPLTEWFIFSNWKKVEKFWLLWREFPIKSLSSRE